MDRADTDGQKLANMMIGKELSESQYDKMDASRAEVVASLEHVDYNKEHKHSGVNDMSLEIHSGEIVGIAGVDGNGQTQLAQLVTGVIAPQSGSIHLRGKNVAVFDPNAFYANSFSDAPKGKEFATELISKGADVFFGDASAVDSGAREAIDAANEKAGAIKVFDIGQPADILGQNPCIICSQVTDNAAMIKVSMEAVEAGTFGGNTVYGTLENGALSAGAINTELVPADKVEKYNAYLEQMKAGTFMQ